MGRPDVGLPSFQSSVPCCILVLQVAVSAVGLVMRVPSFEVLMRETAAWVGILPFFPYPWPWFCISWPTSVCGGSRAVAGGQGVNGEYVCVYEGVVGAACLRSVKLFFDEMFRFCGVRHAASGARIDLSCARRWISSRMYQGLGTFLRAATWWLT